MQPITPLPYTVASAGVFVFEGQTYVVVGLTDIGSIDVVLRYSTRNKVCQRIANLNCPRGVLSVAADDKYMYAIGGLRKNGSGLMAQWEHLNTIEFFHRESKFWSYGPELLSKGAHGSAVYLNQKIFLIRGQSELLGISKAMDVYDMLTHGWTSTPYLYHHIIIRRRNPNIC